MTQPTIVMTGTPHWAQTAESLLGAAYVVKHYTTRAPGYVARLADDHAALIMVDGTDNEWRFWTTTPKASPATRRIPILLVAADKAVRSDALIVGADLLLAPDELSAALLPLVSDYARILDPAVVEQLDCDCAESLPPLGVEGITKFNSGEYYRQHDLFEEQWMHTTGPVRDLYRAILQVGIAYYQITRGNYRGALKMFLRSVQWLSILPDTCQGVDVKQFREDSYRVRAELERMNPEDIAQFDRSLLKPVIWRGKK